MKCVNHPERESQNECGLCGKNFCSECLVSLGDRDYCRECLENRMKGEFSGDSGMKGEFSGDSGMHREIPVKVQTGRRSRFWSFILSLIPGVGYMYLGLMKRGLQTMVAFFGSIFITSFIGFQELMSLVVPVVVFYSIFDTQQLAKKINEGIPVEDAPFWDLSTIPFNQKWIGYALIVIGFLAMMNSAPLAIPYWFKKMLPPVIIIGLGVAILYRNTRE